MLSNASLDKLFWAEAIMYVSHLLNRLPMTVIGGKTPLKIWSDGAALDHVHLEYLVVWLLLMSRKTCWTLK